MINEIWKDVRGYEGYYQVSNCGRVKSVARMVTTASGRNRRVKEKIMTISYGIQHNTASVSATVESSKETLKVRSLVWDHFGDRKRDSKKLCVVNIDGDGKNNHIDNLKLMPRREIVVRFLDKGKFASKYLGVTKCRKKWSASHGNKWLGVYNTEEEASEAYEKFVHKVDIERGYCEATN